MAREAEIAQLRAQEIAEHERQILTAAKSQEESRAQADATSARAVAVQAEEDLATLRQVAEAERRRKVAMLAAQQDAEANATRARITAETDREVAKVKGAIRREEAETTRIFRLAEAEAETARIAAENTRSAAASAFELERARLAALPGIVAEMVKPAEKITGISINHVTGLGRGDDAPPSPVAQTVDSILDLAVTLPAMKRIGDVVGVNLQGVVQGRTEAG
jgi:uncharacterized membrane protein YqiK